MKLNSICTLLLGPFVIAVFITVAMGQIMPTAYNQSFSMRDDDIQVITLSASSSDYMFAVVNSPQKGLLYQFNSSAPGNVGKIMLTRLVEDPLRRVVYKANNFQMATTDSFGFKVQDPTTGMQSEVGNISITILSVNDPPFCKDQPVSYVFVTEDTSDTYMGAYTYLFWDLDSEYSALQLTFTYMTCGELREFNVTNRDLILRTYSPAVLPRQAIYALNVFYYVPPRNYVGEVLINFTVNDGSSSHVRYDNRQAEPCTIKYLVRNVNDPPMANDISIITDEDTIIAVTLNCTDIDPDDAITEYKIVPPAEHRLYQYTSDQIDYSRDVGQIIDDSQGRFWFSPFKDYYGVIVVAYQCRDKGLTLSNSAVATITVNPVNDPPTISCVGQIDLLPEFVNGDIDFVTIKLTAYDVEYQNITFKLIDVPQRGYLFGDSGAIYSAGDSIIGSTVIFNANRSGAGIPYANFSFIAIDEYNACSEICVVRLNATCDKSRFLNIFSGNAGPICTSCPSGAICSRNGSFLPIPTYGYWKVPEKDNLFLECSPPSACIGASEACNAGYTGPICAKCAAGYFRLNADCVPCRLGISETLAIAAVIALLGGGLIYLSTIISKRGPALGLFGLFVNFVQTVIVIRGLELPWPVEFQVITDILSVLNLNLDLASPECFIGDLSQFRFKMRAILALPGVLFAAVTLCGLIISVDWGKLKTKVLNLWQERRYLQSTKSRANLLPDARLPATQSGFKASTHHVDNNLFVTAIKVANILLSISYLSIAKYSLGLFDCVRELDGKTYLDADKSLQCYQDWWTADVPIASFGIVFYVIGIPLYYFAQLLIIGQINWTNSRMQKIRNLCRKTFGGDSTFREGYQFCILLQLIQKLALLLINMFFTRLLLAQIMSMLVILHVSFVFYWKFRPYAYQSLNYLELAGIACSKIVLLGGIMFHVPPLLTEKERKLLSVSIVVLVIGYLIAIIGAVVYEYFVIRRKSRPSGK